MKLSVKRIASMATACTLGATLLAGCGGSPASSTASGTADSTSSSTASSEGTADTASTEDLAGTEITFLNSKGEIQEPLEDMAATFIDATGIKVEVLACGAGEVPYTKITSMYNSGTAPTMAMLDANDVISLASEKAVDLSNEKWTAECADTAMKIDGKVYSFPFCVEGRGIIYNKATIEKTLGTEFDPSTINSYDSLKALMESLRTAGMENPIVISKEDWSLGGHMLGYIYDTYDGTNEGVTEVTGKLASGELKAEDYERFNQFTDTVQLLMEYNYNKADPLGAMYEQDPMYVADGDAAMWFNGCWAWPNLDEAGANADDGYGFIPFTLGNEQDFNNTGIQAAASKQVMIDREQASEQQIAAAEAFLNWMVYDEQGQKMLVEDCALIPACSNNTVESVDPLGANIREYMAAGKTFSSSTILPSDHWSVMGAAMQKFIAGQSTPAELAQSLDEYWAKQA